ncbi:hypothetical protein E2562_003818 [Oryza meyeriana var. granulata]|uniref:Uncharacterized protein n=1 Tax=Oryza meyeriana var. granulata TaxID=110450 RepID=A0A6G1BS12_9ORYZ|nr:hypothetical protein E2562_003818 [Oryza meyeriana var. granulata]
MCGHAGLFYQVDLHGMLHAARQAQQGAMRGILDCDDDFLLFLEAVEVLYFVIGNKKVAKKKLGGEM